jgi:uncharacterized protein (UPF0335 family)
LASFQPIEHLERLERLNRQTSSMPSSRANGVKIYYEVSGAGFDELSSTS